jgi:hypothetical protein
MTRLRRGPWNGVWFALGRSFVVTLLAVGIRHVDLGPLDRLGPYLLAAIGVANIVFAAGFETASRFSALVPAGKTNPGYWGWRSVAEW